MIIECGSALALKRKHEIHAHLWIVITSPSGIPPEVAIVSVTTRREHSDETVILSPGDHPFIRHESVVHYGDILIVPVAQLVRAVQAGEGNLEENVAEEVLADIQDGVLASPHAARNLKEYCRERF